MGPKSTVASVSLKHGCESAYRSTPHLLGVDCVRAIPLCGTPYITQTTVPVSRARAPLVIVPTVGTSGQPRGLAKYTQSFSRVNLLASLARNAAASPARIGPEGHLAERDREPVRGRRRTREPAAVDRRQARDEVDDALLVGGRQRDRRRQTEDPRSRPSATQSPGSPTGSRERRGAMQRLPERPCLDTRFAQPPQQPAAVVPVFVASTCTADSQLVPEPPRRLGERLDPRHARESALVARRAARRATKASSCSTCARPTAACRLVRR